MKGVKYGLTADEVAGLRESCRTTSTVRMPNCWRTLSATASARIKPDALIRRQAYLLNIFLAGSGTLYEV